VGELANTDVVMNDTFWIGVWPGISQNMVEFMTDSIHEIIRGK
jgi:CDP-6-deoxy-D-xylo-4-hexulose-3-dehydrase